MDGARERATPCSTISVSDVDEKIASMIAGKQIVKVIVVPGKLINIVLK